MATGGLMSFTEMLERTVLAFALSVAFAGCAGTLDVAAEKTAAALEQTKDFAVSADALYKFVCVEPRKSFINAELVKTGVVEPGALDKACTNADLGLDVGYAAVNSLVDVYSELTGTK